MSPESGPADRAAQGAVVPVRTAAEPASTTALQTHASSEPAAAVAVPVCANCGASVAAKFCGNCGQRLEHSAHSVWHFTQEATEDLTHADSRLWATLYALLFKPGFLTQEFFAGRRARYLPPLRLYLVLSVLFFLIASAGAGQNVAVVDAQDINPNESAQQRADRICSPDYQGEAHALIERLLGKNCHKVVEDSGRSLGEAFLHNLPHAMFLFLPVLALAMLALYWHPRHYYVEHLLFFVHNHAFVFLLISLMWLLSKTLPGSLDGPITFIACLYVPYYMYASMRRVYGQGRARTFFKLMVLSVAYLIIGLAMLAVTSLYSALTL